jgi:translocation and assembly module TamA
VPDEWRHRIPRAFSCEARVRRTLARRGVAAALAVLLLALPDPATRAADPMPYTVDLGTTSGDKAIDQALHDAATLISLRTSAPVGPFALVARASDDRARFLAVLHSFGYYQGKVELTIDGRPLDDTGLIDALEAAPAAPPAQVAAKFELGPLFHLGAVSVTGSLPPGMEADLGIRTGDPARAADVLAAGDHLLATLRQAGYALATVAPPVATLHPDQGTLDVAFAVNAGPRVDLGEITISGLDHVHEAYVRNRLTLHPGETFNPTEIETARADLAGLGVFSSVRAEPATQLDSQGRLPVTFVVTEAPPRSVDLGLSYATDLGVTPSIGWHHHNLFGNGEQLNLTASASNGGDADTGLGYKVGAQFIKPDFLACDQSLQVEVDALRQDLQAYDQNALLESVTLTRPLWPQWSPHWTGSIGLSAEQEYILQEDVGRSYDLIGVPMTLKYDSSNNVLEPTKGIRAAFAVTPTKSLSGGDATFLIMQASASTYFDVSGDGRSVVAVRGLLGQVAGAGQFSLPPDQRFYAGGSATVRGFRYQSVGPQFADGKPTGGTAIGAGTVELRQRLFGNWGTSAFVDAGQVNANGAPLAGTWRIGAGVGVRYYTSIGPIRLDVAVPVNRAPGGDAFELYIGLGEAF